MPPFRINSDASVTGATDVTMDGDLQGVQNKKGNDDFGSAKGVITPGNLAVWDADLNLVDGGAPSGGGDVTGPASVTADGNIARYDGLTGKIIQDSSVRIDAAGNVLNINNTTGAATNLVTGTAGPNGNVAVWDSGNIIDGGAPTGDVVGPASATDNALTRFNGTTGKIVQNSGVFLSDLNNLSGINDLTMGGALTGLTNKTGNGDFASTTGATTTGNVAVWDANDNLIDGGPLTGEANTISTPDAVGADDDLVKGKVGVDLQLKRLVAGSNVTISDVGPGTGLQIDATLPAGTGDVQGPASSTNNAIARYDGTTGKLIQNSSVTISDLNNVAGVVDLTMTGVLSGNTNRTGNTNTFVTGTSGPDGNITVWDAAGNAVDSGSALADLIIGPVGAVTDNALVRWDGIGGKLIQNSSATLTDAGVLTGVTNVTGSLGTFVTGTAGTTGNIAVWNANDVVGGTKAEADLVINSGTGTNNAVPTFDSNGQTLKDSAVTITGIGNDVLGGLSNVTGADTDFVTGTAGTNGNLAIWNIDGDVVDGGPVPATGEANTASVPTSSSADDNIYRSKVGVDLQFKRILGGTNITVSDNGGTELVIDASGVGTGDVVGPASATDEAIARFDTTTGKLIQNSVVTASDTGAVNGVTSLTMGGVLSGVSNVTGADTNFVTGTAGSNQEIAVWNIDGDLISIGTDAADIVLGPASSTDHALARFDLTSGKVIQNSTVTLSDTGDLSGVVNVTMTGTLQMPTNVTGNVNTFATGTAGGTGNLATWDANGDLQDGGAIPAGDVVGPASSTDDSIALFEGTTGKLIRSSNLTVTATDDLLGVVDITMSGALTGLTNKTGTGNFASTTGATSTGNIATWDANGNLIDGGSATGEANTASVPTSVVAGDNIVQGKSGVDLQFKALVGGTDIVIVDVGGNTLQVNSLAAGEANTMSTPGGAANEDLFAQKTGVDLQLKRLIGGTDITITDGGVADTLTIDYTGSGGTGDVVGPASATDHAVARFDTTTGKLIQNSVVVITDAGVTTGMTDLTINGDLSGVNNKIGTGSFASALGTPVTGNIATWDANDNLIDSGQAPHDPTAGRQTISIPATAMTVAVTNGAELSAEEIGTTTITTALFDSGANEAAHFEIPFPDKWNKGTVTVKYFWTANSATTNGVAWTISAYSRSDNEAINSSWGTTVTTIDNQQGAANELNVSAESTAITIANTPADGDMSFFRIIRDTTNGSDTLPVDAKLIGIQIFFTTDAENDG